MLCLGYKFKKMSIILLQFQFITLLLWCITIVHAQNWFATYYYPPINHIPIFYPLQFIDSSYDPGLYGTTTFVQLDPVNTANTGYMSQICIQNNIPSQFLLDNEGHCFAACTEITLTDPTRGPLSPMVQLYCTTLADNYIRTYSELLTSKIQQPQYMTMNCSGSGSQALSLNWYNSPITYDMYTLIKEGVHNPVPTVGPFCFESKTCFQSIGLPKTVFDGPAPSIVESNQKFYCCKTANADFNNVYSVMYTYTCTATLYDPIQITQVSKLITCTRSMNVSASGYVAGTFDLQLQAIATDYTCSIQCVYPYFTAHNSFQNYNPQPTSNGCAPSDATDLCTINVLTYTGTICNPSEQLTAMYPLTVAQAQQMGGDSSGLVATLSSGPIPSSLDISALFKARTWIPCQIGQVGCVPYCNCLHGCPNHQQCNNHGTLWESDNLGTTQVCMCNPGYVGTFCQNSLGSASKSPQTCNNGQKTCLAIDNEYFIPM